ncbi:MAG TPA: radical SAM family heme chaperone HemW [Candidatus Cloacimonadota bacterium]|nr:radical SAM family heme chaperone HemW [Candidatus Cloacimonadota bacterium]
MKNKIEYIYIHVPFCLSKCGYCSFYSERFAPDLKRKYLRFLQEEIAFCQQKFELKPKTIYFGGGTPSLLSGKEIDAILHNFDLTETREITLEANPVCITPKYTETISQTKINRISLGIQSFDDSELQLLGRLHNGKQAENALRLLRENGFSNLSFDLIYGLPKQTINDLRFSLEKFIELAPPHISTYCLSLEPDVPLYFMKSQIPHDEQVAEFYFLIRETLIDAGYRQYEISNFAQPGMASQHNLCYWNDQFYLGLGPAAAGYLFNGNHRIRYTNPADLQEYFQQIEAKIIFPEAEEITETEQEKEFIFLALRKTEGLNLSEFQNKFGENFREKYKLIIEKYQRVKLLELTDEYVKLLPEAYFVSNEILAEFV